MAQLRVLEPCRENYDAMHGAGATRFCDRCRKSVTNLSELTRAQAQDFLAEHAGQSVCVRYRVRRDGALVFKPAAPMRLAFVAALSLAMAACTGFVDADELDSPDDALVCHDAAGYAIACDAVDEGVIPLDEAAPETVDEPDEIAVGEESLPPEGEVQGGIQVGTGEGCPIPAPDVEVVETAEYHESMGAIRVHEVRMGTVEPSAQARRAAKREARRQARVERRLARRDDQR
jgi:hypothetical protein